MGTRIKNVHLLNEENSVRRDVYIEGTRIMGIDQMPENFTADLTIDGTGRLLMPGLINCHTHAYMSVFRNYADDLPFDEWLFRRIAPLEDKLTAEQAYWGNILSIAEMIRTGTTCFIDMQMFPKMAVKACADTGMRAVITRGLVGKDRNDEGGIRRLKEAFDEMEYGRNEPAANVTFALGPHAIYTCGQDYLEYVAGLAKEKGLSLNIHCSETQYEYDTCLKEHGMTPTAYLNSLHFFDVPVILAHCVYLDDGDFELLKNPNVSVALNPASNMKLANGFPPAARMMKEGINVCLGTDGASSNNSLNMFQEMRLLSLSQKGAAKDSLVLTADETLKIAIENGYRAAGLESKLGKIEKGRTADLILLDENAPNFQPHHHFPSALVYSSTGCEVTDVLIGGKVVMKDRSLTTIDEERMSYEIQKVIDTFG
jgi:5-methylthioadenosine/S-adenosylhomocysteine deaminase